MKNSQWEVWVLMAVALFVILVYACQDKEYAFDLTISKPDVQGWMQASTAACDSAATAETIAPDSAMAVGAAAHEVRIDTTHHTILFFGDSMLEGLSRRFADYAAQNHYDLHTVIWYSSSTKQWAETDTLQYFMEQYQPSFLVMCVGSNELFVNDLNRRDIYIKQILRKIGNTPYVWISPPNWKDDTGINDLIIRNIGKNHYFDSRHLTLARKSDHAHPTFDAAAIWMDSVATWMSSQQSQHPIRMDWPEHSVKLTNLVLLMPPK